MDANGTLRVMALAAFLVGSAIATPHVLAGATGELGGAVVLSSTLGRGEAAAVSVADAQGRAENGSIHTLELLVRGRAGAVSVDGLTASTGHGRVLAVAGVEAARDADGSLEAGELNHRDVARVTVDLAALEAPWGPRQTVELTLEAPGMAPVTLVLESPSTVGDGVVSLDFAPAL